MYLYSDGHGCVGDCESYLIFVIFFTQPQFKVWKFYTWKSVNLQQKLPREKTAYLPSENSNHDLCENYNMHVELLVKLHIV